MGVFFLTWRNLLQIPVVGRRSFAAFAAFALALSAASGPSRAADAALGGIPAHLRAIVTGEPASAAFVTQQIDAAIARDVTAALPAGSQALATAILPAPQPLDRGFLTSFAVSLAVRVGPDGTAQPARTIVDVQNVDVAGFTPVMLAFRDDPEKIVADGVLSRTVVRAGTPTRVYYYHQNSGATRRFCVVLSANDSVRTRVHVVGAIAGPNIDVMSVGHAATRGFLARKPDDLGSVIAIAGGRPYLERDTPVADGEVVVGAVDLDVLDGGPVTVTVLAIPPGAEPPAWLYAPKLPDDGHARHGNFDLARFGQRIVAYTVGGPPASFTYGTRAQTPAALDPADGGNDFGDYGVLERITFDLANPTALPATVYLYEKPLGGVVRSSFLVDGALVEVGCVRVPRPYAIASIDLAGHETRALDVVTMTDGGSNYPLQIGTTVTPPIPSAPPIRAPDGCFPKPAATVAPAPRS